MKRNAKEELVNNNQKKVKINSILEAVKTGNIMALDELVKDGATINIKDSKGNSLLHIAAHNQQLNMINHLITKYKLNIFTKMKNGNNVGDLLLFEDKIMPIYHLR